MGTGRSVDFFKNSNFPLHIYNTVDIIKCGPIKIKVRVKNESSILSSPALTASRKPYKHRPPGFFNFRIIAKEPARNHQN
jgi:hypothetical protein